MSVKFEIKFLGAAGTVTGSSYLVKVFDEGDHILTFMVDHGMFQGPDVEPLNFNKYDFSPKEIDYLFLTHAHVDHCGLLPKLVRHGFGGKIFSTAQTFELADLILFDSVKIQARQKKYEGVPELFDANDVENTLQLFDVKRFDQEYKAGESDLKYELIRAGHILGAASVRLCYKEKVITFSGDLGRASQPIVNSADLSSKESNYIICESLYGGKFHDNNKLVTTKFIEEIAKNIKRGGNVIVPTFSVQRSQEILLIVNDAYKKNLLPRGVQIYFDSPLAQRVTKVYTDNNHELEAQFISGDPLSSRLRGDNVKFVKNYRQTQSIMKKKGNIIVTGGGMCNGGKVLSYFKSMLNQNDLLISIVGFQAEETLGRELVDGAEKVEIDNDYYDVDARIEVFRGFSAHADQEDLLTWLNTFDKDLLEEVFLVHAEIEQSTAFKTQLDAMSLKSTIPTLGQTFLL
jgi:metallo-beta-lactamase family protein